MKLTKYERETIICYNEEEATASVYTHNKSSFKSSNGFRKNTPTR